MSIANSHPERAAWLTRALRAKLAIEDLRAEITVALQSPISTPAMIVLAESDQDLADAQAQIATASGKIAALP